MIVDLLLLARAGAAAALSRCRLAWLPFLLLCTGSTAWADLLVYPTRLVFEGTTRAAQLDLINNGKEAATYRVLLVNKRMTETGGFEDVKTPGPGEQFADTMLRYSPRQVVLAPGAAQSVRLSLRKPADLVEGEYRSHLHFERVPDAGASPAPGAAAAGQLGVQLQVLVGVTIPVIVRHGATRASVTLSDPQLHRATNGQPAALSFVLHRKGNRSVYGDLSASFTPQGGAEQQVGKAGGVAVYTPNPLRRARLEVKPPAGMSLAGGTLRLTYRERPEDGGRLLAETSLQLP